MRAPCRRDRGSPGVFIVNRNERPFFRKELTMPMIQGGPPEAIWERTPDPLKWQIFDSQDPQGGTVYESRVIPRPWYHAVAVLHG